LKKPATASSLIDIIPPSVNHAVGAPFRLLQEYLEFYWVERSRGADVFFGPLILHSSTGGMGKKLASTILAKELGLDYLEILPHQASLESRGEHLIPLIRNHDHQLVYMNCGPYILAPVYEDLLCELLTENTLTGNSCDDPPLDIVLIVGTQRRELLERYRGRIRMIRFQEYSEPELKRIYSDKIRTAGWSIEDAAIAQLLVCSGGNIGMGVKHLETAYLLAQNRGEAVISAAHIQKAHDLLTAHDFAPLPPKV